MNIQYVKGVGPAVAKKLDKLGIADTKDVIYFFPNQYQDRRNIPKIIDLSFDTSVLAKGFVRRIIDTKRGRFNITKIIIQDDSDSVVGIWYNQSFIKNIIKIDSEILVYGKLEYDNKTKSKNIKVSDYEFVDKSNVNKVIPIYSLTKGIYQKQLRAIISRALAYELKLLQDPFTNELRKKHQLISLEKAVYFYHYPPNREGYLKARHRLVFDDFFYLQLALAIVRSKNTEEEKGISFKVAGELLSKYLQMLPYQLTGAQKRVVEEVKKNMNSTRPMNRLIQGDVGSGKTEIAVAAILIAIENGYQVAMMAPTEILAYQHYQKMLKYLIPLNIRVELLVGSLKGSSKIRKQNLISTGIAQVVIGTHALIQETVKFYKLGLAIIDEQHRFGVLQRSALKEKSREECDLLVTTATPIPRSLTLTLYGDLDKSILDEMPPGRTPIKTVWLRTLNKEWLKNINKELSIGNQVYWVFPLVEESEKIDLKAATQGQEHLMQIFPENKMGLLHGKMKQKEKDTIMTQFRQRKIDILVATTVIEVGIDVPDATVIVIEHAERFGLSQLHQLRGRVGRGEKASYCLLLSRSQSIDCKKRLSAMVETTDGFKLAEVDLELRGPGDYVGSKQSGLPTMIVANLVKDEAVLLKAKSVAEEVSKDINSFKFNGIVNKLKSKPHLYVGIAGMN